MKKNIFLTIHMLFLGVLFSIPMYLLKRGIENYSFVHFSIGYFSFTLVSIFVAIYLLGHFSLEEKENK